MEFMDSFERSLPLTNDSRYNGEASDLESCSSNEICDPLRVNAILKGDVENGYKSTPEKKLRKKKGDKVFVDGQFSSSLGKEDSLQLSTTSKYR